MLKPGDVVKVISPRFYVSTDHDAVLLEGETAMVLAVFATCVGHTPTLKLSILSRFGVSTTTVPTAWQTFLAVIE